MLEHTGDSGSGPAIRSAKISESQSRHQYHWIINLGLPPEEFDAFASDEEECSDPVVDEPHCHL